MSELPLLSITGLTKTFPGGAKALDAVDLTVNSGEILAVVGHNGSGKSTLIKILAGVYQCDAGATVEVRDRAGVVQQDSDAVQSLHFIHQNLGLIDDLTAVENLGLTQSGRWNSLNPIRTRDEYNHVRKTIDRFGATFDPTKPVGQLTPAQRTVVAIARAMSGWTRPDQILVLDEPTAAFHGDEARVLFDAVREVSKGGAGVIFVSHRLDEVMSLAHRVLALRNGKVVGNKPSNELDRPAIVELIAGRSVATPKRSVESAAALPATATLVVEALSGSIIRDLSFEIRAGEIVGASGLAGSGRDELGALLFGASQRRAGRVIVAGDELLAHNIRASIDAGMGFLAPDRHRGGGIMQMSVRENLTLPLTRPLAGRLNGLRIRMERREALHWASKVELKPLDPEKPLRLLSGGNQQKILLAKWLRIRPRVLVLDEPTQGVDIGAKAAIHQLVIDAAQSGAAVLVCSSDTKELVDLCDRVMAFDRGQIVSTIPREQLSERGLVANELGFKQPLAPPATNAGPTSAAR